MPKIAESNQAQRDGSQVDVQECNVFGALLTYCSKRSEQFAETTLAKNTQDKNALVLE